MSKDSDVRFTPQHVLNVVREFDEIVCDPCTVASNPAGANLFYTEADNGLVQPWGGGLTFVNNPYSRGQIFPWAEKCALEAKIGLEIIQLIPADMSTIYTKFLFGKANAVAFWDKRIVFDGSNGAKFGSAFWYFGDRQGRFKRVFEPHATVLFLR
jgi:hypothetical protein